MNFAIKISGSEDAIKVVSDEISLIGINQFFEKYQKNSQSYYDDGKTCIKNEVMSSLKGVFFHTLSNDKTSINLNYSSKKDSNGVCIDFMLTFSVAFKELLVSCRFSSRELFCMGQIKMLGSRVIGFYCFEGITEINNLLSNYLISTKFYAAASSLCLSNEIVEITRKSRNTHKSPSGDFLEDIYQVTFHGKQTLFWIIDYDLVDKNSEEAVNPLVINEGVFEIISTSWIDNMGTIFEATLDETISFNPSEIALYLVNDEFAKMEHDSCDKDLYFEDSE